MRHYLPERIIVYFDSISQRFALSDDEKMLLQYAKQILKNGFSMAMGDNFATKLLLLTPVLLSKLNNDDDHMAAYGLTTTMISLVLILLFSPLYVYGFTGGGYFQGYDTADVTLQTEKRNAIGKMIRNGLLYSVPAMCVAAAPLVFSSVLLENIFQQRKPIADIAQSFLRPYALSVPGTFIAFAFTGVLIASGRSNIFLVSTAIMAASLGASCALAFGVEKIGLPAYGLNGVLMGYIAEPYLDAIAKGSYLFLHPHFKQHHLFRALLDNATQELSSVRNLVKNGAAISAQVACDYALPFALLALSAPWGAAAQAAFAMALLLQSVNAIINIFYAVAGSTVVGDAFQNNQLSPVLKRCVARIPLAVSMATGAIFPIIFAAKPDLVMQITGSHDDAVRTELYKIAPFIALASALDSQAFQLAFIPRSWEEFWLPVLLRAIANLAGAAIGIGLSYNLNFGEQGIAMGYMTAVLLSIVFLGANCYRGVCARSEGLIDNDVATHDSARESWRTASQGSQHPPTDELTALIPRNSFGGA